MMIKIVGAKLFHHFNTALARRFINGAAWISLGTVAFHAANIGAMIAVARVLGKNEYGQYVILQSTLSMLGIFAGFGIGTTATRFIADLRLQNTDRLADVLGLTDVFVWVFGVVIAVSLALSSDYIGEHFLKSTALGKPLVIASGTVLFSAIDGYKKSILIGVEAMKQFAIVSFISAAALIPITIALTHIYGLSGAAAALVLNSIIQSVTSSFVARRELRKCNITISRGTGFREWRVLRDFSLPALLAGAMVVPAHWLCQTMLAGGRNGYSEIAILGVAMQWFNVITYLPGIAGRVLLPILTERYCASGSMGSKGIVKIAIVSNLGVAIPFSVFVAAFSPWLSMAYGKEFFDAWKSLSLISLVAIFVVGAMPIGQMLAAANKMWLGAIMNTGWALIYIVCAYSMFSYGALGIVSAMGIAYIAHTIWISFYAIKVIR